MALMEKYEMEVNPTDKKVIIEKLDVPLLKMNELINSLQEIARTISKDDESISAKLLRNKVRSILIQLEPVQSQLAR